MLPKNNRIGRAEFESIIRSGKRIHSPIFILYIQKTEGNDKRFGFSVSKKISKSSVQRNKLRRQGYSVIRDQIKHIKDGFLFVFVYKKTQRIPTYQEIEVDITGLLKNTFVLV